MSESNSTKKFFNAIAQDDIKAVSDLLASGITRETLTGSPVLYLIKNSPNSISTAKLLIKHGADINAINHFGSSDLHKYSAFCNLDLMRFAINSGANIQVKDQFGFTPLLSLCTNLKSNTAPNEIEMAIKLLVDSGANLHEKEYKGRGAIGLAYEKLNYDVITALFKYGVNQMVNDNPLLYSMINDSRNFKAFANEGANIHEASNSNHWDELSGANLLFYTIGENKISLTKF